jgi:hypothetical protein
VRLVIQVVIVSAVVTAAVVFAGVLSGRSGNLLASFSDWSALQGLLTVVLFFSLSYGLIGGTAGGLLLLRAKSRLESSSLSIRALWGLKWGAFLGFLIPATIAGLTSVISADAGFEWSAEHLVLPLLGAFTGSVSGVIVSTCCLFPRHFSAVSTLKKVSPG